MKIEITGELPKPNTSVEKKIDSIWKKAKSNKPGLFNGPVLSLVKTSDGILEAKRSDYRSFLAQKIDPTLYKDLKIKMLAVSGLVMFGSKTLFGKRARSLTQDAGKWELVPSGGLAQPDIEKQFFEELEEELGILPNSVSALTTFLLVEDTESHIVDIGVSAVLTSDKSQTKKSEEYSELLWIDKNELTEFCKREHKTNSIVRVSIELLDEFFRNNFSNRQS